MKKIKTILKNMATIVACFVVTTMSTACDKSYEDDYYGNGGGGSGSLSDEERELVGKYSYGSGGGGYWTYYSYNYDQWTGTYSFAHGVCFKSDGTYQSFSFAQGSSYSYLGGGQLVKSTAKWCIPEEGIVRFSNYTENIENADGTKSTWRQSEHPDWNPDQAYSFGFENGKYGIYFLAGHFYEME
jgi:hypothetical protein